MRTNRKGFTSRALAWAASILLVLVAVFVPLPAAVAQTNQTNAQPAPKPDTQVLAQAGTTPQQVCDPTFNDKSTKVAIIWDTSSKGNGTNAQLSNGYWVDKVYLQLKAAMETTVKDRNFTFGNYVVGAGAPTDIGGGNTYTADGWGKATVDPTNYVKNVTVYQGRNWDWAFRKAKEDGYEYAIFITGARPTLSGTDSDNNGSTLTNSTIWNATVNSATTNFPGKMFVLGVGDRYVNNFNLNSGQVLEYGSKSLVNKIASGGAVFQEKDGDEVNTSKAALPTFLDSIKSKAVTPGIGIVSKHSAKADGTAPTQLSDWDFQVNDTTKVTTCPNGVAKASVAENATSIKVQELQRAGEQSNRYRFVGAKCYRETVDGRKPVTPTIDPQGGVYPFVTINSPAESGVYSCEMQNAPLVPITITQKTLASPDSAIKQVEKNSFTYNYTCKYPLNETIVKPYAGGNYNVFPIPEDSPAGRGTVGSNTGVAWAALNRQQFVPLGAQCTFTQVPKAGQIPTSSVAWSSTNSVGNVSGNGTGFTFTVGDAAANKQAGAAEADGVNVVVTNSYDLTQELSLTADLLQGNLAPELAGAWPNKTIKARLTCKYGSTSLDLGNPRPRAGEGRATGSPV